MSPCFPPSQLFTDVFSQHGSSWKVAFALICTDIGEYTSHDTEQGKDSPWCCLAAAGTGFPLPHPIQDLPLILTLGFALKPLMLLK